MPEKPLMTAAAHQNSHLSPDEAWLWQPDNSAQIPETLDLSCMQVSQVVIAYADWKMKQQDPRFPVGKARLEAIGVLACRALR